MLNGIMAAFGNPVAITYSELQKDAEATYTKHLTAAVAEDGMDPAEAKDRLSRSLKAWNRLLDKWWWNGEENPCPGPWLGELAEPEAKKEAASSAA